MTITIKDGVVTSDSPMNYMEVLKKGCAMIEGMAKSVIEGVRQNYNEDAALQCEAELFDITNRTVSLLLERAFPNQTLRPDLTEEAIMLAENQLLKERLLKQDKAGDEDEHTTLS